MMPNELVKVSEESVPATGVEETLPVLVERAGGAALRLGRVLLRRASQQAHTTGVSGGGAAVPGLG